MKKRQIKKQNKIRLSRFKEKTKAVVTVDLTDATAGSQIDVYISKKFESDGESFDYIHNEIQNKKISYKRVVLKNFTHLMYVKNGWEKHFGLTVWLSDTEKSYYVIRPGEEVAV